MTCPVRMREPNRIVRFINRLRFFDDNKNRVRQTIPQRIRAKTLITLIDVRKFKNVELYRTQ